MCVYVGCTLTHLRAFEIPFLILGFYIQALYGFCIVLIYLVVPCMWAGFSCLLDNDLETSGIRESEEKNASKEFRNEAFSQ